MTSLYQDLQARGLIHTTSFIDQAWLDNPKTFYLGTDVSAPSLQLGNFVAFLTARRLMQAGWKAVLLVGGATSLVGDPGGKDEERPLKTREEIQKNVQAIQLQVKTLFNDQEFTLVDNYDWFKDIGYLDFLREVGKNYSMTELIQRDFVATRMGPGGSGISYAEFSYTLVQGYDFYHLAKEHDVCLQIGGSDQWGNMLSGIPLIRKKLGKEAHALSIPLLINQSTGKKFGKSEGGALWLDPNQTTSYELYQYLLNTEDAALDLYLKQLTLLPLLVIAELMDEHAREPHKRMAQKVLAREVITLVHGEPEAEHAEIASNILFSGAGLEGADASVIEMLIKSAPIASVAVGSSLVDALVESKLVESKRVARELIEAGAVRANGVAIVKIDAVVTEDMFVQGSIGLLQKGKRDVAILVKK
jgi:tyrosyl-tRNA synthetase